MIIIVSHVYNWLTIYVIHPYVTGVNKLRGFVKGYYIFALWATRLVYLNILWGLFTIVGLGLLGFMPATAGMFAVVRKWVYGEEDIPIFKTFWRSFRIEFIKINLLGYLLLLIGYILYVQFQILWFQGSMPYFIASFGVIALVIIYIIILLYIFPIFAHFNISIFQNIRWAFIIGVVHPLLTIFFIVGLGLFYYITFQTIPILLLLFGGSVTAYILMWGAAKTFHKYEPSNETEEMTPS